MKKYIFGICLLFLVSCGSADLERSGKLFLQAYYSEEYKNASRYITRKSRKDLKEFLKIEERETGKREVEQSDVEIHMVFYHDDDQKSADVFYSLDGEENIKKIGMVKKWGRWRVNFRRNDPMGIAQYFLNAFYKGDFHTAKDYVLIHDRRDLEVLQAAQQNKKRKKITVKAIGVEYHPLGDKARVHYREKRSGEEKIINLKMENGQWKIGFYKSDDWDDGGV